MSDATPTAARDTNDDGVPSAPLELEGYGVAFGDLVVLRGLDLRVGDGDDDRVIALLGAAQSGRTTLLRSLAGLNHADPTFREWGAARMLGQPLGGSHRPPLALAGAVEPAMTTRDLLLQSLRRMADDASAELVAALQPMPWDEIACDALAEHGLVALVERLGEPLRSLAPMHRRAIGVLSHALLSPPLLLVDDPLVGLDDGACAWLVDWLARLGRRQRLIVALDRPDLARRLGGRRLRLEGGRFAALPDAPAPADPFAIDDPVESAFRRTTHVASPWLSDDGPSTDAMLVDSEVDTRFEDQARGDDDTQAVGLDRLSRRPDDRRGPPNQTPSEPAFQATVVTPRLPPPD